MSLAEMGDGDDRESSRADSAAFPPRSGFIQSFGQEGRYAGKPPSRPLPQSLGRMQTPSSSSHFCLGRLPIAFVLSVPGKSEKIQGRPVAGDTGENLDGALTYLHALRPARFSSVCRYDYRITNAFTSPIAKSLGNKRSEAKNSQIKQLENIARVVRELDGCDLVILCGKKAELLHRDRALTAIGRTIIVASHIGNTGLNTCFSLPTPSTSLSPADRRQQRVELWAQAILDRMTA